MVANCLGMGPHSVKAGSPTKPVPGYDVAVLDDDGRALGDGEMGNLVVKLPLPPGCLPTLWNHDAAFQEKYTDPFSGYYLTADAGYRDEDGYWWIMSRTDDVINVAGHRLSTGQMEEVLASHPDVAECAVLGVADDLKGQLPLGLVVLKAGVSRSEEAIVPELVALVRNAIGPVAAFKQAAVVARLPKTRSGKVLRGTVAKNGGWRRLQDARDDRRPKNPRRDPAGSRQARLPEIAWFLHHTPRNLGFRPSRNAATPSFASRLAKIISGPRRHKAAVSTGPFGITSCA